MSQSKLPSSLRTYSVLPDNRSHLERALELSLSQHLYAIDQPYPHLLDAQKTPVSVVPYLAQDRQLPVWDASDSEQVKRNLASNAWQVRRLSGTRAGLLLALESFEFLSTITPWHKQTPQGEPFSLEVVAWEKGNKPVNVVNAQKLMAYIEDIQSERDTIELSLMFGVETSMGMAGARAPATNVTPASGAASLWPMPDAAIHFAVAAAVPPAVNVQPLNLKAEVPVIAGYAQLGLTAVAAHYSFTVSPVNARAELS